MASIKKLYENIETWITIVPLYCKVGGFAQKG